MQLHYHKDSGGNFGDDLNEWIWDDLLPGWRDWDDKVILLGVGTLLNQERMDAFRDRRVLVAGTGVGYGSRPPGQPLPQTWDIRSVRGPHSARALELPQSAGVIDPAAMLPLIGAFRDNPKTEEPIFVPHVASVERHNWEHICPRAGLCFVSPRSEAREVIRRIAAAPLVIAESMHAAIIADAFRVPWIPVQISSKFNAPKWRDWAAGLGMEMEIPSMFPKLQEWEPLLRRWVRLKPRQQPLRAEMASAAVSDRPKGRRHVSRLLRMRIVLERALIVDRLRHVAMHSPCLSASEILARKQQVYRQILSEVTYDYGTLPE